MNQEPLLFDSAINEVRESKKRISTMQFLGTFALGAVLAVTLGSHSPSGESVNFWLNQAKAEYNWNITSVLNWNAVNVFIGVAVSPLGELYGIQSYKDGRTDVQFAYKFDFSTGVWSQFDSQNQVQGLRFDKLGNVYTLDRQGAVAASNNRATKILTNVQDFEVTTSGRIYAVSQTLNQSANAFTQSFDATGVSPYFYKMYSSQVYQSVGLINEVPVYQLANGSLVGYGSQCVRDFSVGVDGAVWAISCTQETNQTNQTGTNFQIIKWDPYLQQWYLVASRTGVKIAAYNEISAAVLTSDGLIYVSSDTGDKSLPQYLNRTTTLLNMFADSGVVNEEGRQWVRNQLQQTGYGAANLLYRASRDGWTTSAFHGACDYKGATITFIKSQTGQVFGGFTAANWTSSVGWTTDNTAWIFQLNNKIRLPTASPTYAIYASSDRLVHFGAGNEIYIAPSANTTTSSSTVQAGYYQLPPGIGASSTAGNVYLHQSSSNNYFTPVEMETYQLLPLSTGNL